MVHKIFFAVVDISLLFALSTYFLKQEHAVVDFATGIAQLYNSNIKVEAKLQLKDSIN